MTDVSKLLQLTPGVNFDAFPRAAPRPFFRGIGSSNQGAGGDPSSVGFLDGNYLGRSAMLGIDFFDLERVEVLKGPQRTLFGKNVVGGALNFITAKPKHEAMGAAELTVGEYGQLDGHFMLNLPLSDRIATRLVLGAVTNDGFRRTSDGRPLDDDNKLSARLQALFDVSDGTSFLRSGDIANQDLGQTSRFNVRVLPDNGANPPRGFFAPADFFDATVRYTYLDTRFDHFIQTSSIRADGTALASRPLPNCLRIKPPLQPLPHRQHRLQID